MAERKVISKYYPPDFDPAEAAKLNRLHNKKTKSQQQQQQSKSHDQIKTRMMLPMSIRCTVCGEYIGRGKKFNARKETVQGESYLGLKVFRFYIRCTKCSSELTFKTDPKNSTYVSEQNCMRNYTPWSNSTEDDEEQESRRIMDLEGDSMKLLENKTMEMRQEMDLLDDLDELRTISAQNHRISIDQLKERWQSMNHQSQSHSLVVRSNSGNRGDMSSNDGVNGGVDGAQLTQEEEEELRLFEKELFSSYNDDHDLKSVISSSSSFREEWNSGDDDEYGDVSNIKKQKSNPLSSAPSVVHKSLLDDEESYMIGFKKRKLSQQQETNHSDHGIHENRGDEEDRQEDKAVTEEEPLVKKRKVNSDVNIHSSQPVAATNSLFDDALISIVTTKKKKGPSKKKKAKKSSALSALCQYD